MEITQEYILSISPDASSTKNANKIFSKTKWSVYRSDRAIWCEIYGSGKKPYLTQVDIGDIAFKCSCPSRKFPCKHSLALGLYIANNGIDSIEVSDEPIWVKEWIDKRVEKSQKQMTQPKVKSQESIEKIEAKRWASAIKSVGFVADWLEDVMKLGILEFPNREYGYYQELKKRMVDLKLVGFNRFFTQLEDMSYVDGYEEEVIYILTLIHQLVTSIKNHDKLDKSIKAEIGMLMGWSLSQKELLSQKDTEVVSDEWIVVSIELNEIDNLISRKVYLYGRATNRWAYILEFTHQSGYFKEHYRKGDIFDATLIFYDTFINQRAFVKERRENSLKLKRETLAPLSTLESGYRSFKEVLISFPWLDEYPLFISSCSIVRQDGRFYLVDRDDFVMLLSDFDMSEYYRFILLSDGEFVDVFVVVSRGYLRFCGFIDDTRVVIS